MILKPINYISLLHRFDQVCNCYVSLEAQSLLLDLGPVFRCLLLQTIRLLQLGGNQRTLMFLKPEHSQAFSVICGAVGASGQLLGYAAPIQEGWVGEGGEVLFWWHFFESFGETL